ncbi:MAG: MFS transporter [Candidatus Bathyarchaeia archaeon]
MDVKESLNLIKDVLSNRNILSISLTTSLWSLIQMGWNPFWPKYMKDNLGATAIAIGLVSSITTAENMIFQLPGGLLADRYGRKKIIVWGTLLRVFSPLIYFLAPSWEWVILGAVFNGMASLYMPAFTSIVADSMPESRRGTGYGAYSMITSLPQAFSPIIGGMVMDRYGYVEGVKTFLSIQIAVCLIMVYIRWRYTEETLKTKVTSRRSLLLDGQVVRGFPSSIKVMMIVSVLGSISIRLVMDFTNLYALEVVNLTNTQLGLVQSLVGLISSVLALPGGMLSDRYGRKGNIMLSRLTTPITQWLMTIAFNFESYLAIRSLNGVGLALGGGGMYTGGPSWNALIADIVPQEKRGTVFGAMSTITAIFGAPSSIIGGWLWDTISRQAPFHLSGIIGLIGAIIFWLGVKEPRREEER